jgi:hypothetical protein
VSSLAVGTHRRDDLLAGVMDLAKFFPRNSGIEGFLAPQFFHPWPFSVNSVSGTVRIERETVGDSIPRPRAEVPIEVERKGPSLTAFVDLHLPSGSIARVEVDTGSDLLILDAHFMKELGVDKDGPSVKKYESKDETGNPFVRYFSQLSGPVRLRAAPRISQRNPAVMFQDIIYDGLIGDAFLRSFDVTYDMVGSRMLFADPA